MSKPFESIEKQQLGRAITCLEKNASLAEKGENLPATLRALGICHTLMKYHADQGMYKLLVDEIKYFDKDIFRITTSGEEKEERDPIRRIKLLNQLSVQAEMMLFEHLMSFAVEFRRVAKVINKIKEEEKS